MAVMRPETSPAIARAARRPARTGLAPTDLGRIALAAALLALSACDTVGGVGRSLFGGGPQEGQVGHVTGFLGGAVADEPRAVLAAREVLSRGGNAADAAVALGFMLSVTLPSRAGLGGGGGCVAYMPDRDSVNGGVPEAVVFPPVAGAGGGDRPAAVPMLPRGLFALHARYGKLPFEGLLAPAEQAARFGFPASRALVRDLQVVAGPLLADPNARAVFAPGGAPIGEGSQVLQPELGATIAQLRVAGVGDLYQGALARRLAEQTPLAGGPLSVDALRAALPRIVPPVSVPVGDDLVAILPSPPDNGAAVAAAIQALQAAPGAARPAALGGGPYPASTTFATLDHDGNAVVCALTMDNLFGTGRIVPGTGLLLAASPRAIPTPVLAALIAWNSNIHAFRAAVGGSGQEGAALAAAFALQSTLATGQPLPTPPPEPGRANVIACARYLPDHDGSCSWATDPRGAGLAAGGN